MINFNRLSGYVIGVTLAINASSVFAANIENNNTFCEQLFVNQKGKVELGGQDVIYGDRYIATKFYKMDAKYYQKELYKMARKANYALTMARDNDKYVSGAVSLYENLTRHLIIGAIEKIIPYECVGASLTRTAEALSRGLQGCAQTYINDALTILTKSGRKSKFIDQELAIAKKNKHGIENMSKVLFLFGGSSTCEELPGMRDKLNSIIGDLKKQGSSAYRVGDFA